MRAEPLLCVDDKTLVVPVRKKDRPHFRKLANRASIRVGRSAEADETHKQGIAKLMGVLTTSETLFISPTFDEEEQLDQNGQVILGPLQKSDYWWWDDTGGTRIPIGNGRYIQPDICGYSASPAAFWHQSAAPAVVIEVVQTHFPEKETLFQLLHLSELNFLVFLYFIAPGRTGTKYSRIGRDDSGRIAIRMAHYFSGRQLFENGAPWGLPAPFTLKDYSEWYDFMESRFLTRVMDKKNELPKPRPIQKRA